MRLIGPNCLGVLNTDPRRPAERDASGRMFPPRGRVGVPVPERRARAWPSSTTRSELGLGLSSFVSVGNKADISGNDLIQYWESDDRHRR